MTHRPTSRTLLAISLLVAFTGANAAGLRIASSLSTSNVQLNVIDLTPDDGQTGGYAQSSFYSLTESELYTDAPAAPLRDLISRDAPGSGTDTTQVNYGSAHASSSTTGVFGQGQASATLSGSGVSIIRTGFDYLMNGMLSPHTALVLTGHITIAASLAGVDPSRDGFASSVANFRLAHERFDRPSLDEFNLYVPTYDGNAIVDRDFRLSYSNNTDFAQKLNVAMYFESSVFSTIVPASPVPEPGGYAMLGAGLLLLGAVARRRKSAVQA